MTLHQNDLQVQTETAAETIAWTRFDIVAVVVGFFEAAAPTKIGAHVVAASCGHFWAGMLRVS